MFLHKDYIDYSIGTLKSFSSMKSISNANVPEIDRLLTEMNFHVENSIKEAVSHNSSYSALVDLMTEHPRGISHHLKLKKWAIDLIHQLKQIDSTVGHARDLLESYKKYPDNHGLLGKVEDKLRDLLKEIEKYNHYSRDFANALVKEEESADHVDHVKVKSEIVSALQTKKHLNPVYVTNITSWF